MTAVRPEFRAGELAFDPADPVFGGGACLVPGCERTARGPPLCAAHHDRWQAEGRPGAEVFAATTDPRWRKQMPLALLPGPRLRPRRRPAGPVHPPRPRPGNALAGLPCRGGWPASPPTTMPAGPSRSARSGPARCGPRRTSRSATATANTWKTNGCPDPGEFARGYAEIDPVPGHERIRLDSLAPQLKLEIQYALQRRRDERDSQGSALRGHAGGAVPGRAAG